MRNAFRIFRAIWNACSVIRQQYLFWSEYLFSPHSTHGLILQQIRSLCQYFRHQGSSSKSGHRCHTWWSDDQCRQPDYCQLKENDQLGWTFVPKDAAIEGVKSGKYYAAIIIPQDFSESLLSVLSGKIETPELEYYINEKLNAIAPKITSSGASTIQTQVNNTFSSVASEQLPRF